MSYEKSADEHWRASLWVNMTAVCREKREVDILEAGWGKERRRLSESSISLKHGEIAQPKVALEASG